MVVLSNRRLIGWKYDTSLDDLRNEKGEKKNKTNKNSEQKQDKQEKQENSESEFPISSTTAHTVDIQIILYNSFFFHLITIDYSNIINVWAVHTTKNVFRFSAKHKSNITAACLDESGRRLLTGSADGEVCVWNYNDGILLKQIIKENLGGVNGILSCSTVMNPKLIILLGNNRSIISVSDSDDSSTFDRIIHQFFFFFYYYLY
jgi:WD40 repeat protein